MLNYYSILVVGILIIFVYLVNYWKFTLHVKFS